MDVFTKAKRSEVMRAVKSKNTRLELLFRRALWRKGFRYSTNSTRYFGTPDLVLKRHKTVIFVDSCFWHGCGKHCRLPSVRISFWKTKIANNRTRDRKVTSYYRRYGWRVFRIWEHDIKISIDRLVRKIEITLGLANEAKTQSQRRNATRSPKSPSASIKQIGSARSATERRTNCLDHCENL